MKHVKILHEQPDQLDFLMCKVSKLLFKNKKQILKEFGLTSSQFDILSAIYYFSVQKREIIQIDLSEKTEIDPMTTSTILRNLQLKGLIVRNRGVINTRTVIVELTSKGFNLYKDAMMKVRTSNDIIYQSIDKGYLISQLVMLSEKLNQLNC